MQQRDTTSVNLRAEDAPLRSETSRNSYGSHRHVKDSFEDYDDEESDSSENDHDALASDALLESASSSATVTNELGWLGIPKSVWWIYVTVAMIVTANMSSNSIQVLYFNSREWTSPGDVVYYVIVTATGIMMPVVLNPLLGFWQGRRPTKEIFVFEVFMTTYGFLAMALVDNRWVFLMGYALSRLPLCVRAVRMTYVMRTTSAEQRTQAISMLPLFALLGAVVGPFVVALCALAPDAAHSWVLSGIDFNQYTITMWVGFALNLARLPIVLFAFKEERFSDRHQSSSSSAPSGDALAKVDDDGSSSLASDEDALEKRRVWLWWLFFAIVGFLVQFTFGIYVLTLQPILVNAYGFDQTAMAIFILVLALASLVPPVLMGLLSKRFGILDRNFLLIGILGMIVALTVYSVAPVSKNQAIAGGVLMFPFMILFGPSSNSLFSKLVGNRASGLKVGLLASASSLGPAFGALIGGQVVLPLYTTATFMAFIPPAGLAIVLILVFWRWLVPAVKPVVIDVESSTVVVKHSSAAGGGGDDDDDQNEPEFYSRRFFADTSKDYLTE
jgi:MFS family permease